MRIVCFTEGLYGDLWPTLALGWHLAERDHDVTVAVPGEFQGLAERAGLRTMPLPFDMVTWLRTDEGKRMLRAGGIQFFRAAGTQFSRYADQLDEAYEAAAQGAEAIVGNLITIDRALAMADRLRVPATMLCQYPVAMSGECPSVTMTRANLRLPALNRASGRFTYWVWRKSNEKAIGAFRAKLGLPRAQPPFYRLLDHGAPILHTLSPTLFPRPSDWADNLSITGAWKMPAALRDNLGEGLPGDLEAWLAAGDPPVFLGFGSMPVLDPQPLLEDIVAVTTKLGLRAIVSENCAPGAAAEALPGHLRTVGAVDHDLLFPRCSAVVHHGGLGSTIASLRAGRPTMVCSVFADQPWWGERVKRLGAGCRKPFHRLDRRGLERGLRHLHDPRVAERAGAIGAAIEREGDGLPEAVQLLEDWLVVADPVPLDSSPPGIRVGGWADHAGVDGEW